MKEGVDSWMASAADARVRLVLCRHGWFHVLDTDTFVGRSLINYGEWTEAECALLASHLRPGDNVIDVGAHVGTHAVPLARAIAPSGVLIAFEPQGFLFDLLGANLSRNGFGNARLFKAGCGERWATATISTPDYGRPANFGALSLTPLERWRADAGGAERHTVSLVPIDGCCDLNHLSLIKVDAEGMELDVLQGAEQVIRRFRPIIYVENEDPARSEALLQWLTNAGYDLYWHAVPLFPEVNFNAESRNLFGSANCINNLCMPNGRRPSWPSLQPVLDLRDHPRSGIVRRANSLNRKAAELMVRRGREVEARGDLAAAAGLYAKAHELKSRIDGVAGGRTDPIDAGPIASLFSRPRHT
jgi:FkbM family methyltransferase